MAKERRRASIGNRNRMTFQTKVILDRMAASLSGAQQAVRRAMLVQRRNGG
jgi:hypothetical protein